MRFIHFFLIAVFLLSGCRTYEGLSNDISSVFGEVDDEKPKVEPINASDAAVVLDPFYKKNVDNASFDDELAKHEKKPVKQKVIVMPKCYREEIAQVSSVSDLYKYYNKKSASCVGKTYKDTADRIYKIVMTNLRKQEIRLLNGDETFSFFIIDVLKETNSDLTEVGKGFLTQKGCGLLDATVCEKIKNI